MLLTNAFNDKNIKGYVFFKKVVFFNVVLSAYKNWVNIYFYKRIWPSKKSYFGALISKDM